MEKATPRRRFPRLRSAPLPVRLALVAIVAAGGAATAYSVIPAEDLVIIQQVDQGSFNEEFQHQDQNQVTQQARTVNANLGNAANRVELFTTLFDHGDELFEFEFNAIDGGGALVNGQQRFTRVPRADVRDGWFLNSPGRSTGANSNACIHCHSKGVADGPGDANSNVHRDPFRTGLTENYIQRNAPHVHGAAGKQRLGEEMTLALLARRDAPGAMGGAADCNCRSSSRANPPCAARRVLLNNIKGVDFGSAVVSRKPGATSCTIQVLPPTGFTTKAVSDDLVVRPFQWKGSVAFIRDFNRGAMHNELGMQGEEFFDKVNVDGDRDGVAQELTVGDLTSLTLYIAGQPRPTSLIELDDIRGNNPELAAIVPPLPQAQRAQITRGSMVFNQVQCDTCHVRQFTITDRFFKEPSEVPDHRDRLFPGGRLPAELGLLATVPVQFDITNDQPDNKFNVGVGQNQTPLGSFRRQGQNAIIEIFSDLRRHDLGPGVAEPVDEVGTGKSVFITTPLWGAGTSSPYLHDGRAVTLTEAILWHKGEAEESRRRFVALPVAQKRDLIAFLNNLILFLPEEEEGEGKKPPPGGGGGGAMPPGDPD
jgi:hypothetical protein